MLITGASSGIGAATAALLAERGMRQALHGRDRPRLRALAAELHCACYPADLREAEQVDRLGTQVLADGPVDAFIGNAGIGWSGRFQEMSQQRIQQLVAVNLTANLLLARAVLPAMISRGSGRIVFVGSIAGSMAVAGETAYAATKSGVHVLAQGLRAELADTGVVVSVFIPGVIDTPFFAHRGQPYDRKRPRPVPVATAANALVRQLDSGAPEVFTPAWLRLPARLRGALPSAVQRAQRRFG